MRGKEPVIVAGGEDKGWNWCLNSFPESWSLNLFTLIRFDCPRVTDYFSDKSSWWSFLFLATSHTACGILVSWPGIRPASSAQEAWTLNHSTAREVLIIFSFSLCSLGPEPGGWPFSLSFTSHHPSSPPGHCYLNLLHKPLLIHSRAMPSPRIPMPTVSLCQPVTLWTSPFIPWRLRL